MEILKGMVRDAGYPDVECTYGKLDNNTMYYFIEAGQLPNGNIIASTVLKEAIGHAPHTSLGVIDKDGNVIIPFENKNIRQIRSKFLLVEKNVPTTESVLNFLKVKDDPVRQDELKNKENEIKEQLIGAMGMNGDFIFANMFSEATVYTFDGLNVSGGYFSYISELDGNYYFTSNVPGSQIIKFNPDMLEEQQENTGIVNEDVQNNEQSNDNAIGEISEVTNDIPTVEGEDVNSSINEQVDSSPLNIPTATNTNENNVSTQSDDQNIPQVDIPIATNINEENSTAPEEEQNANNAVEETAEEQNIPQVDFSQVTNNDEENNAAPEEEQNVNNAVEETAEEQNIPQVDVPQATNNDEENNDMQSEEQEETMDSEIADNQFNLEEEIKNSENSEETSENIEEENNDEDASDNSLSQQDDVEDTNSYEEETSEENEDDSEIEETEEENPYEKLSNEEIDEEDITNPVIFNATTTIKKLLDENRNQREIIDKQAGELEALKTSYGILSEDNKSKEKEIYTLHKKMVEYRTKANVISRENVKIKSTMMKQSELMQNLERENKSLREQVAGIHALGTAVAEANVLTEPLDYSSFSSQLEEGFDKAKSKIA